MRETVSSFQSSSSQPLRYSSTQFNQSPEREQSKFQASTGNKQSVANMKENVDVRDRIITTYKDEIRMHVARERDFQHLQDLIAELQRKTQLLELSLSDSQKEHEERLNSQAKTIVHH